jgi:hypothetical protein
MKGVVLTLLFLWCILAAVLALRPFNLDWSCFVCRNGATLSQTAGQLAFPTHGMARTSVSRVLQRKPPRSGRVRD